MSNWISFLLAMLMSLVFGWTDLNEQKGESAIDQIRETLAIESTTIAPESTTIASPAPEIDTEAASSSSGATRLNNSQVVVETIPAPSPSPPMWVDGDCESFRPVLEFFGDDGSAAALFIDGGILWRETGCGLDTLNESTGDSGPCQINPIHNRSGWFGGKEFGSGGWLGALHGLTTRQDLHNVEWVNACLTLYRVCGSGPWRPPYSCANNRLP